MEWILLHLWLLRINIWRCLIFIKILTKFWRGSITPRVGRFAPISPTSRNYFKHSSKPNDPLNEHNLAFHKKYLKKKNPCRKTWSGRWSAQARNVGSQCWLSILDRWSVEAWTIIAGLYWLVILAPKSLPMLGQESLPELSRWPFKFIMILIMTIKFKNLAYYSYI